MAWSKLDTIIQDHVAVFKVIVTTFRIFCFNLKKGDEN